MAIAAERLRIEVEADTSAATRDLQGLEREGSKIPGWAKAAGAALAGAFAVDKIVGGARAAIAAASDLQQSVGGVEAVFGSNASAISAWANTAAKDLGLSQNAYNEFATVVGSQLKNMGVPMDEVTGKTADLITKGADLAATFGGTTSDAVSALSSLMRGETDPIERYGVSIKDADVQARMAAMGLSGLEGEAGKAARTQALLALLTDQTAAAQGSFARESDTLAGGQQRLAAGFTNLVAVIGGAFLPAASQVVSWASDAVDWFAARLPGALDAMSGAWSALVGLMRSGDFTSAFRDATGLSEDSPFVRVLLTIRDAVTTTADTVRDGFTAMREAFSEGGSDVTSSGFVGLLESVGLAARNFLDPIVAAFGSLGPTIGPAIGQVVSLAQAFSPLGIILQAITPVLPQIGSLLGTLATTLAGALLPVLGALMPVLTQVAGTIVGALASAFQAILPLVVGLLPVVTTIASVLGDVLLTAVNALAPVIGILGDTFADLIPALSPVIDAVLSIVQALLPVVSIVGDLIGSLLPPLVEMFTALLQPILALIAPLVGVLAPILNNVAMIISTFLVPVIGTLADWLTRLLGFIMPVTQALNVLGLQAIGALIQWLIQAVGAVASFAGDAIGAFGRFAAAAGEKVGEAVSFVAGIPGMIAGVFSGAGSWLVESGRKIIQGLVDGIKGMAKKVTDAVSGVLGAARDLLPFSPAKKGPFSGKGWTLYSGRSISSALADGILQEGRSVVAATREVAGLAAMNLPGASIGSPSTAGVGGPPQSGAQATGPSPADSLGVGSASGYGGPSTIVVVDADGTLIGTMRVQAGKVATGQVTPLDEGRPTW